MNNNNTKIEFFLEQIENKVILCVFYLDERFVEGSTFKCSNGIYITNNSKFYPELTDVNIHLNKDYSGMYTSFPTEQEALAYKGKVIKAFKEWAKEWTGWGSITTINKSNNIYRF